MMRFANSRPPMQVTLIIYIRRALYVGNILLIIAIAKKSNEYSLRTQIYASVSLDADEQVN